MLKQKFEIGDEVVSKGKDLNAIPVHLSYENIHGIVIDLGKEEHAHLVHVRDFDTGVTHTLNGKFLKKIQKRNKIMNSDLNEELDGLLDNTKGSPNLVPLVQSIMNGQPTTTQDLFNDAMKGKLSQAIEFYKQTQLGGTFNNSDFSNSEDYI